MKADIILAPTDFSPMAEQALNVASSLAAESGATLVILHVAKTPRIFDDTCYAQNSDYVEALKDSLEAMLPTEPVVAVRRLLLFGDPGECILRAADSVGADVIVMGTHGRTGLCRFLMGSVAQVVVRRAPCPVLTVKAHSDIGVLAAV